MKDIQVFEIALGLGGWTLVKKTDRKSEGIMIWAWSVF